MSEQFGIECEFASRRSGFRPTRRLWASYEVCDFLRSLRPEVVR